MKNRKRGIDEIIQNAINEGEFDQLPGKGKPLEWDAHSPLDDDWQLANHLLKENGFAADFIEARQSIESDLAAGRSGELVSEIGSEPNYDAAIAALG